MSLYGMMRTSVSGMAAQAGRLSTVADNIANAGTSGYKRVSMQFATQVLDNNAGNYNSGGVSMNTHRSVSEQGTLRGTNSATDLAINGNGFFVVQDGSGDYYLTRDGGFFVDSAGDLVNSSGQRLMGFDLTSGDTAIANGFSGLTAINASQQELHAEPTTQGTLLANLPANDAAVAAANLPANNASSAEYSGKTSMVVFDSLGNEKYLDVYFSKSADQTWQVSVFDAAASGASGSFPYSSGPLTTETLEFDATTGKLTSGSASSVSVAVPGGETMTLDLSGMSQLGSEYSVISADSNGTNPASVERLEIGEDGVVYGIYQNGFTNPIAQIALAKVPSPDSLQPISGNNFSVTIDSGDVLVGQADSEGYGSIVAGALEESNVDMASELTIMIESQRSYTANSKVFQTGSDLMDVLVNLKR